MSLDVYLLAPPESAPPEEPGEPRIFVREDGQTKSLTRAEWDEHNPDREPVYATTDCSDQLYWANITHNLGGMANAAGLYLPLWQPGKVGITTAKQLIEPLREGLELLMRNPDQFIPLNPSNGWGNYDGLIIFVREYLEACEQYPDARVEASR